MKLYKAHISPLNQIQIESLIGMILGDASLQKQKSGDYRLKFDFSAKNLSYAKHIKELLGDYIITDLKIRSRKSPNGNLVENVWFQTISHPEFNLFGKLFINSSGKKSPCPNLIRDYLTPRGLAYWFMDDGGKMDYSKSPHSSKGIVFHTQGFSKEEVEMLSQELNIKFGLDSWVGVNKKKWVIKISSKKYSVFLNYVEAYILPEMKYKLPSYGGDHYIDLYWRHSLNSNEN